VATSPRSCKPGHVQDVLLICSSRIRCSLDFPAFCGREELTALPARRNAELKTVVVGSLAGGMTFDDVQREYDITADDIRAALRFVGELAEQESFHPLPAA
jgi:hypothetical protein